MKAVVIYLDEERRKKHWEWEIKEKPTASIWFEIVGDFATEIDPDFVILKIYLENSK